MKKMIGWSLLLILLLACTGCSQERLQEEQEKSVTRDALEMLPEKATDIDSLGKGWVKFSLDGERFLFFYRPRHIALAPFKNENEGMSCTKCHHKNHAN